MRPFNLEFRRALRREATSAERLMWKLLRGRRFDGAKFRRQHSIGPYVADFYCAEHRLVVELDGHQHQFATERRHDSTRDAYLRTLGLTVLRFTNFDLFHDARKVVEALERAIAATVRSR